MYSFLQKEGVNPTETETKVESNKKENKVNSNEVKKVVLADSEYNCIEALLRQVTKKKETKVKELKKVEEEIKKLKVAFFRYLSMFFLTIHFPGGAEVPGGGAGGGGGGGGAAGRAPPLAPGCQPATTARPCAAQADRFSNSDTIESLSNSV